jgi:pre-mRNA-splicing factor RBM22/SLT11
MPSLQPPDDESIRTLYIGGLDARISEQDLRDQFYVHGEIETVRMVLQRACAFVTYTTREAAEKAAEELANKLVIKGVRLKLMWGRPQQIQPKPEEGQPGVVMHGGMLPRAVISQQQNSDQPPAAPQQQQSYNYFNIPERVHYPSMDPQRMGAVVLFQEAGDSSKGGPSQHAPQYYPPQPHPYYQGGQYPSQYYAPPPPHSFGHMGPPAQPHMPYPPQHYAPQYRQPPPLPHQHHMPPPQQQSAGPSARPSQS